jgi:hypothetical protein
MKKISLILLILLTGSQLVKAENTPIITIEYIYKNVSDTSYFANLKSDNDFCCNFLVTSSLSESNENVTLLRHTKTGVVLGTFYGRPSKEFIMEICRKMGFLDSNNVDMIAENMLKIKKN